MKPTVAIIGIGLIGGSLGQALRRSKRYRVLGIARKASYAADAKRAGRHRFRIYKSGGRLSGRYRRPLHAGRRYCSPSKRLSPI